jgi:hypothetical protein
MNPEEVETTANMIISIERQAKYKERLAIMEILIEEIKHAQIAAELEALDRVAAAIKHRTAKGL